MELQKKHGLLPCVQTSHMIGTFTCLLCTNDVVCSLCIPKSTLQYEKVRKYKIVQVAKLRMNQNNKKKH